MDENICCTQSLNATYIYFQQQYAYKLQGTLRTQSRYYTLNIYVL